MGIGVGVVVGLMVLAAGGTIAAGQDLDGRVDGFVAEKMKEQKVPGLALGVLRDGKMLEAKGFGLANVELDVAVKPETVFQTGSVGKQFTATAVMMLVEEGKVGLDDKIGKYLAGTPAAWKNVTVRNLLTHTSGIADYTDKEEVKPGGLINLRGDYTEETLYRQLVKLPMEFAPGAKWKYSNTNYVLLGFLIHKVTGRILWGFSAGADLPPAGDERDADHQRGGHCAEPGERV